jgi:Mg2+ and Co2+ transporter CorA
MLSAYVPRGTSLERIAIEPGGAPPAAAVWIDLVAPTVQEDNLVEQFLGIAVPTREEMQEIEVSSRLYVENGARYMTATLMCQSDTAPKITAVTFILSGHRLATVRYDEPRPFAIIGQKLARACSPKVSGEAVLMDLLDAVIDRSADILERIGAEVDQISHTIFEPDDEMAPPAYNDVLKALGRKGDLTVEGAGKPGLGRPPAVVSGARSGKPEMGQGRPRANNVDATRRDLAYRSRQLSQQQDHLPARRHAGRGQHPAERHHQDFLDRRRGVHAADAGGLDLRHEFPHRHDRTRLGLRLPLRADLDRARRGTADCVFQVEEVAVRREAMQMSQTPTSCAGF